MGFLMTGGIMTAAAAYLWKRRRKTEGGKIAVMLFALVFLYPSWPADQWRKSGWDTSPPCCCPRRFRPACSSTGDTKCQLVSGMSSTTFPRASRCTFYYSDTVFPRASRCALLLQRHGISKGEQVCPFITATRYFQGRAGVPFYYSDTVFPRASRCALLLQRHGISKGEQVCPFITATRYFQGRAGVSFTTATRYFQGRAGVSFTTAALLRVFFKRRRW